MYRRVAGAGPVRAAVLAGFTWAPALPSAGTYQVFAKWPNLKKEIGVRVGLLGNRGQSGINALAAGDPDKACEIYRAVAKEQGIPLE